MRAAEGLHAGFSVIRELWCERNFGQREGRGPAVVRGPTRRHAPPSSGDEAGVPPRKTFSSVFTGTRTPWDGGRAPASGGGQEQGLGRSTPAGGPPEGTHTGFGELTTVR